MWLKDSVAIVVPEYNEGQRAIETIENILKHCRYRIIVVDDGSELGWQLIKRSIANNPQVLFLRHEINLGKGAAMKTGVIKAWELGAKRVIFIDSDGQHDPKYLPAIIKGLEKYPAVFSYRPMDKNMPLIRKWGNYLAVVGLKYFFGITRKDVLSGFFGFNKSTYPKLKWYSRGYEVETEIATKVAREQIPYGEIKIDTIYIDKYKGVGIIDALKIMAQVPIWYIEK